MADWATRCSTHGTRPGVRSRPKPCAGRVTSRTNRCVGSTDSRLDRLLVASGAGLTPPNFLDVHAPFEYPDRATAMRGLKSAGVVARAIQHSGEAAVDAAYSGVLESYGRPDGSYRINAEFRYLIARAE